MSYSVDKGSALRNARETLESSDLVLVEKYNLLLVQHLLKSALWFAYHVKWTLTSNLSVVQIFKQGPYTDPTIRISFDHRGMPIPSFEAEDGYDEVLVNEIYELPFALYMPSKQQGPGAGDLSEPVAVDKRTGDRLTLQQMYDRVVGWNEEFCKFRASVEASLLEHSDQRLDDWQATRKTLMALDDGQRDLVLSAQHIRQTEERLRKLEQAVHEETS